MRGDRYVLLLITLTPFLLSCDSKRKGTSKHASVGFEAPEATKQGLLVLESKACYFDAGDTILQNSNIVIENPLPREVEQVNSIVRYTGLPQNFSIYRGNVDNALATVADNRRLIVYNKDFFARMDAIGSSYWSSMFILAHEIGHHLAANISDTNDMLKAELQADAFAGAVLYAMGADSNEVVAVFASNFLSDARDTKTHPSKFKRMTTVQQSWQHAAQLRFQSAIPPPIPDHFTQAAGKHPLAIGGGVTSIGFGAAALAENKWVQDNRTIALQYLQKDTTDLLRVIETGSRNYQGIILDVQVKPSEKGCEDILFLEVEVLVTKTDTVNNGAELQVNTRNRFLVCLDTGNGFVMKSGPKKFFAGGRRLEFDILDIQRPEKTGGLWILSRAAAV